jgi:hypothetical protein
MMVCSSVIPREDVRQISKQAEDKTDRRSNFDTSINLISNYIDENTNAPYVHNKYTTPSHNKNRL